MQVATRNGLVRGKPSANGKTLAWRGIPYARAARFAAPKPCEPWEGERDATKFGPVAMQSRDPRTAMMSGVSPATVMAEDCLCLNVTAPVGADGAPVVVWLHGGAFVMGSASTPLYRGEAWAEPEGHDGIVCVTINYRLGALGLLYLGHLDPAYAEGNQALLDQIAALRWVADNIRAFGGDPARVTVMGESAGAVAIGTLLALPAARGLFARAILESGASQLTVPVREDAIELTSAIMRAVGATTAAELVAAPVEAILEAQFAIAAKKGLAAFAPYVDGVTVPREPIAMIRAGEGSRVPILAGTNRDEWALFAVFLGDASVAPVKTALAAKIGEAATARLVAAYAQQRDGVAKDWVDLIGDLAFRMPVVRLAEASGAPAWVYRFDWRTPAAGGVLGAAHAVELPFLWQQLDAPTSQFLVGGDAERARPLGHRMHAAWVRFITDGTCDWPAFAAPARSVKLFDTEDRVVDDPNGATRALWAEIMGDPAP